MHEAKVIEEMAQSNGTDRTIVILFLAIVLIFFSVFLKGYLKSLDEQKEMSKENNKNYIEMIRQMTEAITRNTSDVGDFKCGLEDHDTKASESFRQVNSRFDDLEKKVDIIEDKTDNVATKTMITEVKEDLKDLRNSLKKD